MDFISFDDEGQEIAALVLIAALLAKKRVDQSAKESAEQIKENNDAHKEETK